MKQIGLFDEQTALERLSKLGDPLERLSGAIDFEVYRPLASKVKPRKSERGRPNIDCVVMLKVVLLERLYDCHDENLEYQLNNRLDFMRFLGLSLTDPKPDATTVWRFKEAMSLKGLDEAWFAMFNAQLEELGVVTKTGTLIDATFVDVPRRRALSSDQEQGLKESEVPPELVSANHKPNSKMAHQLSQIDLDARWAKKGEAETHFGYKNHVKADRDSKIITDFLVTAANVNEVTIYPDMVNNGDLEVHLDAGYVGEERLEQAKKNAPNAKFHICNRAQKNKPLSYEQIVENTGFARARARIEHIFGFITYVMRGDYVSCRGFRRCRSAIAIINLSYNMRRFLTIRSA